MPERKRRRGTELTCLDSSATSLILRPIKRFTEAKVFSGLTTAWRLAICCLMAGEEEKEREER